MNKFGAIPFGSFGGKALTPPTFTRAGSAWDDAVAWAPTNITLWSEDFSNAYWTKTNVNVTLSAGLAPNGTNTANLLVATTTNAGHGPSRNAVFTVGLPSTISVYAKAAGYNWCALIFNASATAFFDLASGVVGNVTAGYTATITPVGNGWYRCSVSSATTPSFTAVGVNVCQANGSLNFAGDNASGIYVWGLQSELSPAASTYIPTTSAVVGLPRYGGPDYEPTVNLAQFSEQFDNADWAKARATITANAATAPDGTITADKLVADATAGQSHFTNKTVSGVTVGSGPWAFSVYVKAAELSWVCLSTESVDRVFYNLTTGQVGTKGASVVSAGIESTGDGWWRCWFTRATAANTSFWVMLSSADNVISIPGNISASGVYLWGAQVEQKAAVTPYTGATLGAPRARGVLATEPTKNYLAPTVAAMNDATQWTLAGGGVVTKTTDAVVTFNGQSTIKVVCDGASAAQGISANTLVGTLPIGPWVGGLWLKGSGTFNVWGRVIHTDATALADASTQVTYTLDDTWRFYPFKGANGTTGKTVNYVTFFIRSVNAEACTFWASSAAVEIAPYSTGYSAGSVSASSAGLSGVTYRNGIVIEEGTTNLVQRSSELDNAYWTLTEAAVTANAIVAPDGTLTADKLTETVTNSGHFAGRSTVFASGSAGTISVYMKAAERSWGLLSFQGCSAYFDLSNGKVGTVSGAGTTASITPVGGGWFRCAIIQNPVAVASQEVRIFTATGDGVGTYVGTVGSGIYVWGIQAEQKAYPTSLVPTAGANGVRVAEACTVPSTGMNPISGVVAVRAYVGPSVLAAEAVGTVARALFYVSPDAINNTIYVDYVNNNLRGITSNGVGATTTITLTGASLSLGWHTIALRYSATELTLWVDGVKRQTLSGAINVPGSIDPTAYIGNHKTIGNRQWGDAIPWVAWFDRVPSDAEMVAISGNNAPANATALIDFRGGALRASSGGASPYYGDQYFQPLALANTGM